MIHPQGFCPSDRRHADNFICKDPILRIQLIDPVNQGCQLHKLPTMSEDEMLKLLAADGMLVKRPLLVGDDFVLVGFKEAEWESRLKK